jgi:hypothetical protein
VWLYFSSGRFVEGAVLIKMKVGLQEGKSDDAGLFNS